MPIPIRPVKCIQIGLFHWCTKRQSHSDLSRASRLVSNDGTYARALPAAREPSLLANCHENLDRSRLLEYTRKPSLLRVSPPCYARALPSSKLVTWYPCAGIYVLQDPTCSQGPYKRPKIGHALLSKRTRHPEIIYPLPTQSAISRHWFNIYHECLK